MSEVDPLQANPVAVAANTEVFVEITGKRTGDTYQMREATYGVLDPDPESPLSCVSVANSSLSIDVWKGCAWQCSYCHVQGGLQDLDPGTMTMPKRPEARSPFEIEEIIDALVEHPFFEADRSVISIGTASTEPFAAGEVTDSTYEIMDSFVRRGFKNPFWIVTKAGFPIPKEYADRLIDITSAGNEVMISICWANNPKEIEPVRTNRFRNIPAMKEAGAAVAWYLRPLTEDWSADPVSLQQTFEIAQHEAQGIDMIVPGGLRWTEGIQYGLEEVRGIPMPNIPKDDNFKDLSDEAWGIIDRLCADYFPGVSVLRKSSCSLSNMLKTPNHNLVQLQHQDECQASNCPDSQREICGRFETPSVSTVQQRLSRVGLEGVSIVSIDPDTGIFESSPSRDELAFALQHMIEIQVAREE